MALLVAGMATAPGACAPRDDDAAAARARRKARMAVAARDRAVLQGHVRAAESLAARLPALRRTQVGFVDGDTTVILVGHFAGDTLLAIDENVRGAGGVTGQARYVLARGTLRYVALDRAVPDADGRPPRRLRLALGFDSTGALVASSKNVNDAAVNLDTAVDVRARMARAAALAARLSASARAPGAPAATPRP